MRRLTFFLAAVFSVLFAEKALCHATAFSIESESFKSFTHEEMRVTEAAPLSIRTGGSYRSIEQRPMFAGRSRGTAIFTQRTIRFRSRTLMATRNDTS